MTLRSQRSYLLRKRPNHSPQRCYQLVVPALKRILDEVLGDSSSIEESLVSTFWKTIPDDALSLPGAKKYLLKALKD